MVFSSLTFMFIFLPVVLLIYYIAPKQFKNLFILISGLVFYAWGEPVYVVIMIVSTLIDYTAGLLIDKFNYKKKVRLICLLVSLVMNLG
ncbi:MAG: MBOAT family protein, partial [Ruminiclostridium sp.]|nr:MBOAT family protein [Ruminiclostridium sp.]